MSELQVLLEELADAGEARGAYEVFEGAASVATVRRRVRRRRQLLSAGAFVVVVVVAVGALVSSRSTSRPTTGVRVGSTTVPTAAAEPGATATQLANGHWEVIPAPPRKAVNASTAWTGRELLVWGQADLPESSQSPFRTVAMAYNPATRTWRTLPPAPIEAAPGQVTLWTGTELLIPGAGARELGAAYDPTTNLWRTLPRSDVQSAAYTAGVWTGDRAIFFAGQTAVMYEPKSDTWRRLARPASDAIQPLLAVTAAPGIVLAWYVIETPGSLAQNCVNAFSCDGPTDVFRYDESTDRWVGLGPSTIQEPEQGFRAGSSVFVRGFVHRVSHLGPTAAEASALYNTGTGVATKLPSDPVASNDTSATWTGGAVLSLDAADNGRASAYDPTTNAWLRLPSAPFACTPTSPAWTGAEVLMYCTDPVPALPPTVGGLEFVPGSAASVSKPRVTVSGTFRIEGGLYPGIDGTLAGTIVAVDPSGKQYRAQTTKSGRYTLRLPRGTYDIYGQVHPTSQHCGPGSTDVVADATVDVVCSIR